MKAKHFKKNTKYFKKKKKAENSTNLYKMERKRERCDGRNRAKKPHSRTFRETVGLENPDSLRKRNIKYKKAGVGCRVENNPWIQTLTCQSHTHRKKGGQYLLPFKK